ncbi:hypothetical protein F4811DRAFT_514224 [Daldinia bambusicola]|nr:hypothetical protein F4811DRAFT_514224 [Daldinia bambusicola]
MAPKMQLTATSLFLASLLASNAVAGKSDFDPFTVLKSTNTQLVPLTARQASSVDGQTCTDGTFSGTCRADGRCGLEIPPSEVSFRFVAGQCGVAARINDTKGNGDNSTIIDDGDTTSDDGTDDGIDDDTSDDESVDDNDSISGDSISDDSDDGTDDGLDDSDSDSDSDNEDAGKPVLGQRSGVYRRYARRDMPSRRAVRTGNPS